MAKLKILFLTGFGCLPLWGAIIFVVLGSFQAERDYWSGAPWYVIFAIPYCAVTLATAAVTVIIFNKAEGNNSRKLRVASSWFCAFVVVIAIAVGIWARSLSQKKQVASTDESLALQFVERNEAVLRAAGGSPNVFSLASSTGGTDGLVSEYDVQVRGERTVYAIVRVSRTQGRPSFTLACVTPLSVAYREPFKDVCSTAGKGPQE